MSDIVRFDPFEEMRALQKQFFGDDWMRPVRHRMATTDIYTEDDRSMTIEAHLPHFDQDDVDISIDRGYLTIRAEKHEREEDKKKQYVVRESSSSFYRRVQLPDQADQGAIEAHMADGVLRVTIPFKELPEPKKITVKAKKQ